MNKTEQLKAAMHVMQNAGAKFPKFGKALKVLGPLVTANMLFEGFRKLPIIGDIMQGIDKVDAWITKNTIGRIPILNWSVALKKAGQNFLSGGDMEVSDYKQETNDIKWYLENESDDAKLKFPVNIQRDLSYYKKLIYGNTQYSTLGALPKLSQLILSPWEMYNNRLLDGYIDTIYSALRGNLKTNITYTKTEVKCWLLNNVSLYAIGKHLERKLCMRKFKDENIDYNTWLKLWTAKDVNHGEHDTWYYLTPNSEFDANSPDFGVTLDLYDELCKMAKNFVLPSHFKDWIDHYFGSIFTLDNEVANNKFLSLHLDSVYLYQYSRSDGVVTKEQVNVSSFTNSVSNFIEFISAFFSNLYNDQMYSDFIKATTVRNERWTISGCILGWFTKYDEYQPTAISDASLVQALVNGYTNNVSAIMYNLDLNHKIRLDSIDNLEDYLTTILFLGNLANQSPNRTKYDTTTLSIKCLNVLLFADNNNTVKIPRIMLNGLSLNNVNDQILSDTYFEFNSPISISLTSDNTIAINAIGEARNSENLLYYPYFFNEDEYMSNALKADAYFIGNGEITVKADVIGHSVDLATGRSLYPIVDCYFIIPLIKTNGGYYVYARSKTKYEGATLTTWGTSVDLFIVDEHEIVTINGVSMSMNYIFEEYAKDKPIFLVTSSDKDAFTATPLLHYYGENIDSAFGVQNFKLRRTFDGYTAMLNLTLANTCEYQNQVNDSDPTELPITYSSMNSLLIPEYQRFLVETSNESAPSINISNRMYKEYWFTVLGYCLPMINRLKVSVGLGDNDEYASAYTLDYPINLIKEDFTPYEISVDDLPRIIYNMYAGLFNISGKLNTSPVINKTE